MFLLENRACSILYHFLISNKSAFPYILPANICPVVPATFLKVGQTFQFVDIESVTYSLDETFTLELIKNQRIGGVLFVHTYGEPSSHLEFFGEVKKTDPRILIIDDRCLCAPDFSESPMKDIDLILYSTGYGKYVDIGSGGFGWLKPGFPYSKKEIPFNPSELELLEQSMKASVQNKSLFHYKDSDWLNGHNFSGNRQEYSQKVIDALSQIKEKKAQINRIYQESLPKEIQMPDAYNYWRFNILVKNKNRILKVLFENKLFASSHYASLGGIISPGIFPHAESLRNQIVNLFNDQHYSIEQAQKTVMIINETLQRGN